MMPFQLYLYEHFTQLKGFYDHSFGLGGDYVKGLAYYYSLSPIMWVNFIIVWIGEHIFHWQPQNIRFWPTNQLIVAYVRTIITFICAFYYFRYLKLSSTPLLIATILYGASTVVLYYNFYLVILWRFVNYIAIIIMGNGTFLSTKKDRFVHLCGGNHTIFKFLLYLLSSHCVRYLFYITCRIPISP